MKKTQRLIVIIGTDKLINIVKDTIAGFHACSVVKSLSQEILNNVYYYNKNALFFTHTFELSWAKFNPIVINLTNGQTILGMNILGTRNVIKDFPELLSKHNVDSGDHMSQDSTNMVSQSPEKCLLCRISNRQNDKPEHIVYQTENFYVVPGTGAFFEGYLMIVPQKHVMSFALLSKEEQNEFFGVLNDLRTIMEAIYGKKLFAFECGSGRTGAGKHETSIVHAHFHLAPTEMPVLKEVQKSGLHPALIQKEDLGDYGDDPYMLYVDQEDNWFIASDPHDYYPRQHPRQVLAEWMGCYEIYNWRKYPFRERMDVIAEEFRKFCQENFNSLPEWVQKAIRFED